VGVRVPEGQFIALRESEDVSEIASAWRITGGSFYKVQLERRIICDAKHVFSCQACGHACELAVLVVCFLCVVAVFWLMLHSKQFEKEKKEVRVRACRRRGGVWPAFAPHVAGWNARRRERGRGSSLSSSSC
jgi:hypothetical protein